MAINIIGVGVGRTGTYTLKLAINQLGFGPCHHMEEVLKNMDVQVSFWSETLKGNTNWSSIYDGFNSAVDWPTAGFYRELIKEYPTAKFILTERSPESWADSFGSTIYKLVEGRDEAPENPVCRPARHAGRTPALGRRQLRDRRAVGLVLSLRPEGEAR